MRRSTLVAFAAALFWVGLLAAIARNTYGGDIRGFMLVGESFPHPPVFAGAPFSGPIGHDGQFYGALATDPLLLNPETIAVIGNAPAYRAGRVGIPLMAWILALGRGDVAVRLYVLLCWALGLLGVWIAARWLEEEGKSPLWATVVGLSVGLMASLRGALPDAAAASLVVLAIWLNATQRRGALPAIVAACLVRETSVLAAFALGFEELRRRDWRRAATLGGLPILLTAGWRLFVYLRFPTEARAFTASVGFPAGLLSLVPQWRTEPVAIVAVGLTFLAAGVLLRRARRWGSLEATFAAFAALGVVLSPEVYDGSFNYGRALLVAPFIGTVLAEKTAVTTERWALRAVSVAFAGQFLLTIVTYTRFAPSVVAAMLLSALWIASRALRHPPLRSG